MTTADPDAFWQRRAVADEVVVRVAPDDGARHAAAVEPGGRHEIASLARQLRGYVSRQ
jgi:hypothetical protein